MTASASSAASARACLRCIAKKRRCDHSRPICGSCHKLSQSCEYPPPQARRGPVAGYARKLETRVAQCEAALYFVLNLPGVVDALHSASGDAPLPPAPTSTLERDVRTERWSTRQLGCARDVAAFLDECRELEQSHAGSSSAPPAVPAGASWGQEDRRGRAAQRGSGSRDSHGSRDSRDSRYSHPSPGSGDHTPRPDILDPIEGGADRVDTALYGDARWPAPPVSAVPAPPQPPAPVTVNGLLPWADERDRSHDVNRNAEVERDRHHTERRLPRDRAEREVDRESSYDRERAAREADFNRDHDRPREYPDSAGRDYANFYNGTRDTTAFRPRSRSRSPSRSPPPQRSPSTLRNAMGPSLWQLVSAAIPDEEPPVPPASRKRKNIFW